MSAWEPRCAGSPSPLGEVSGGEPAPSLRDFEDALEHHEPEMAAEAARAWCDAWNRLLEMV